MCLCGKIGLLKRVVNILHLLHGLCNDLARYLVLEYSRHDIVVLFRIGDVLKACIVNLTRYLHCSLKNACLLWDSHRSH